MDTRLKKLDRGEVDGLVMAVAFLKRLGQQDRISEYLSLDVCLNAVAQGVLGLETRDGDPVNQMVAFLHHHPSATEVLAERAFLGRLGGGCQIPVGARGYVEGDRIKLMGVVGDASGKRLVRGEVEGKAEDAESLGEELAERLLSQGADELLNGGKVDSKGKAKGNPKPLLGRCIMITRPRIQSGSFVRGLEELGSEVIECPTIEIIPPESYVPLDRTIQDLEEYDWIVFTSVNGVKEFLNRLQYLGKDSAALKGIRLAAIGPETAKEIASHGIQVEFVPAEYRGEGILHGLNPAEVEGKRFLLPRAATARDILPRTLKQWGAEVDVVQAYRTVPAKGSAAILSGVLSENKVDMVTFTSSSTVKHFVDLLSPVDLGKFCNAVAVACIGPITKGTAESNRIRVDVLAKEYTVSGLIEAIVEYFSNGPGRVH
ncbi:MAG: uroporphyrinogen-III synthase [Deltaproteobacteria bacterium]|nr:uroporphyrinogen-III synthase [Deltaproteobacteria bacterium]